MHAFTFSNEYQQSSFREVWIQMMMFYTSSQLMKNDGISFWKGSREKHSFFFQVFIAALPKHEDIVAHLVVVTCLNQFFLLYLI
jgi:hypothetical protein